MPKAIVPPTLDTYVTDWKMSPGLQHDGFVFMTGFTGASADGKYSDDPAEQIETVFAKIQAVLEEAGLGFEHLVEMTSYHVGLRDHLEQFRSIREQYVQEPYPAWTAIEVTGFVRDGAVVEIKCIARKT
ncbi:RidA family protein [uncultured Tateyamaria sp.]|uniref:RidA family protein n=1 Tax=uncultured Tateyamaria sp. TaxID=455651 RepID=UPI00261A7441|nr:RidA family protein [uncultured Tateyamaria sp.]